MKFVIPKKDINYLMAFIGTNFIKIVYLGLVALFFRYCVVNITFNFLTQYCLSQDTEWLQNSSL